MVFGGPKPADGVDGQGASATSELVVKTGSEAFEFEFRGGDKAQRAYQLIMGNLI